LPPENRLRLNQALEKAVDYLRRKGVENARLNAERLLGSILDLKRIELYTGFDRPLTEGELARYRECLKRRAAREPLDYIIGHADFYGRRLAVDRRALIPRPETEQLVESTLDLLRADKSLSDTPVIIEIGAGSGAISIALAAELPGARAHASEISPGAVDLARENARSNGVEERVTLYPGDLFEPLKGSGIRDADLVISNPPYVTGAEYDTLSPEIREHEPKNALVAGPDGLGVIKRIIAEAPGFLTENGLLAVEIGSGQGQAAARLAETDGRYRDVEIKKDYAGHDRMLFARGMA
jgi:release factor glutamine methyltransferase